MFQCFWADKVGDESDDDDRDIVGIDDDEVEAEDEDDDDEEEGEGGILLPRLTSPSSSFLGPRWASRTGSRTRPWNKPNTTVRTNTLNNKLSQPDKGVPKKEDSWGWINYRHCPVDNFWQ